MNTVLAENLYKSLKEVKRTKFQHLPILNYVKLSFENGELILTTTDLESPLQSRCACRMEEEWSTCVPMINKCQMDVDGVYRTCRKQAWHKLYPFLDYIRLAADNGEVLEFKFLPHIETLVIKGINSKAEFKCLNSIEFPSLSGIAQ